MVAGALPYWEDRPMRLIVRSSVPFVLLVLAGCAHHPMRPPEMVVTERGKAGTVFQPQAGEGDPLTALFDGHHRKGPKTTISDAAAESKYARLEDLLDTLPADEDMIESLEGLVEETGDANGKFAESRLPDEERNVRVKAWIYAVKYEDDKDFHVILGSSRTKSKAHFMNAEVSALPKPATGDTPTLQHVREQMRDVLGLFPGARYHKPTKPIAVEVEGSLFYDIDHGPGVVGPAGMRPETSWEIHPVTKLEPSTH
jgi:hypothetical protein